MRVTNMNRMSVLGMLAMGVATGTASAVVTVGSGGQGVTAGSSLIIQNYDYTETWTIGGSSPIAARQAYAAQGFPLPAGVAVLENSHGNPGQSWSTTLGSIATDASNAPSAPAYPGGSGAGSATGFTQTGIGGEGNFTIAYGLRQKFVVQTDAVLLNDRVNIFINNTAFPGGTTPVFAANGITDNVGLGVFFRDTADGNPKIGVYNGISEIDTGLTTGLPATEQGKWHNFAVAFDLNTEKLAFYVDENYRGSFDYGSAFPLLNASNAFVGIGASGGGQDGLWTDNVQVGAPVQYLDTFTLNGGNRVDGTFNSNAGGAYNVEQSFGNPPATMTPVNAFSFQAGNATFVGALSTTGNPGSTSGVGETGGGDFRIAYGLTENYTVSADAILPAGDRFDISSSSTTDGNLFSPNSLNVFFRRDSVGGLPSIGIHNSVAGETAVLGAGLLGINDQNWHNFAVNFNDNQLGIFVDGILRANLNLNTFAGGAYANYSNAAVGLGGTFVTYYDNFRVTGVTIPEPATLSMLALGGLALLRRRRIA